MIFRKIIPILIIVLILIVLGVFFYKIKSQTQNKSSDNVKAAKNSSLPPEGISIVLNEQNKSGENGIAVFKERDGKVQIMIKITGGSSTQQPVHLHSGSCAKPGAVVFPLNNVVNGESITTLDVDLAGLSDKFPLILNLHKSEAESDVYTSCGPLASS